MEIIKKEEFDRIFRYHHWGEVDEYAKMELFNYFVSLKLSESDVRSILNGAKKMAISIAKTQRYVDFDEINALIKRANGLKDLRLFNMFDTIDRKFKEFYTEAAELGYTDFNTNKIDVLITNCFNKAKEITKIENKSIEQFSKAVMDNFWMLACIYSALSQHLPLEDGEVNKEYYIRIADGIMMEILNKLDPTLFEDFKNRIENLEYRITGAKTEFKFGNNAAFSRVEKLLSALTQTDMFGRGFSVTETLSEKELQKLIEHTKSILLTSSQEKVFGAIRVLRNHIQEVNKRFGNKFKVNIKDVFLGAGSILNINPRTLQDSSKLLLGKQVNELPGDKPSIKFLQSLFPQMRIVGIEAEEKQHLILESKRTIFVELTTSSLVRASSSLVKCLFDALVEDKTNLERLPEKIFKLEEMGFNFETIFTADNIFDIISSASFKSGKASSKTGGKLQENFKQNVALINKLVNVDDLQEVIKHNVTLLFEDTLTLKTKLAEIYAKFATTRSKEQYTSDIEEFLNIKIGSKLGSDIKPDGQGKATRGRAPHNHERVEIDEAFIDADLLKEFGIHIKAANLNGPKKPAAPVHPKRGDLNKINSIINDVENGKIIDQDVSEYDFYSDFSILSEEIRGLFSYYDEITDGKADIFSKNKNLAGGLDGTIIKEIALIGQDKMVLRSSKIKNTVKKINKLFADIDLDELGTQDDAKMTVESLKTAVKKVDEIIELYLKEKQEILAKEQAQILTVKENKANGKIENSSKYIQRMIDEHVSSIAKDLARRNKKQEAAQLLQDFEFERDFALVFFGNVHDLLHAVNV